jgi:hypothetical protein
MRDLVNDFRNYSPTMREAPGSRVTVAGAGKVVGGGDGSGWAPEVPLRPPEGVREIDEIAAAFDRRDRAKGLL